MFFINRVKSSMTAFCVTALLFTTVIFSGCGAENLGESTTQGFETAIEESVAVTEGTGKGNAETEKSNDTTTEKREVTATVKSDVTESEKKTEIPESVGDENSKAILSEIPVYSGAPYVVINGNIPSFNKYELTTKGYETYASLDYLGRCGGAVASCGKEIMPKSGESRGSISDIKPSGWVQAQYDNVSGKYLYNRSHLIGWQLSAENANSRNLITGTRYMNTQGMLPFENMVADYIKETQNHVAYRVTPIYEGDNLVASGVQMEAFSVEDGGEGICFNVFCYNVEPGIVIDYSSGESRMSVTDTTKEQTTTSTKSQSTTEQAIETEKQTDKAGGSNSQNTYVYSSKSDKFHFPECKYAKTIKKENRCEYTGKRQGLFDKGYLPCGYCNP